LGQNAAARDTVFHALADATELVKDLLAGSVLRSVTVFSADHHVLPYCQITDRHDNTEVCRAICDMAADILLTHQTTNLSIRWIPGTASFNLLKRLQVIAIKAAARVPPDLIITAPTTESLRDLARHTALSDWEEIWRANPQINPVYRALCHPPSGSPPDFI
jgi:hypothetical protein